MWTGPFGGLAQAMPPSGSGQVQDPGERQVTQSLSMVSSDLNIATTTPLLDGNQPLPAHIMMTITPSLVQGSQASAVFPGPNSTPPSSSNGGAQSSSAVPSASDASTTSNGEDAAQSIFPTPSPHTQIPGQTHPKSAQVGNKPPKADFMFRQDWKPIWRNSEDTSICCFLLTITQNSNVVRFFHCLGKDDPDQLCFYQPGIGTYSTRQYHTKFFTWAHRKFEEAFATQLHVPVKEGYEFVTRNYNPGDKILLFGFSRGAYTARALSGMLHRV
ncbi:hypothetical protein BDN72DRAFT_144826 [Pluteus cervinus]|uniref:Uncharacterized protein n=1 Tax=Pluteus cervinus TaxID=181527 RepID=A0ACD2ZXD3_9AGAR|nr:hypothetical protein BDN72DRAFT_144826 [Pluteus cervinus]